MRSQQQYIGQGQNALPEVHHNPHPPGLPGIAKLSNGVISQYDLIAQQRFGGLNPEVGKRGCFVGIKNIAFKPLHNQATLVAHPCLPQFTRHLPGIVPELLARKRQILKIKVGVVKAGAEFGLGQVVVANIGPRQHQRLHTEAFTIEEKVIGIHGQRLQLPGGGHFLFY